MKQPGSVSLEGLHEVSQKYGVDIATMLGINPQHVDAINL